ncbi:MAG: hydrogen gas-evolving membrane-bound hydrogenase subunit E [Bacillota bacterium]
MKKNIVALLLLGFIAFGMLSVIEEMPTFGQRRSRPDGRMYEKYLEEGTEDTGALNIVSAIITDYRAFDTLGETTVLFTTIAAIYATLLSLQGDGEDDN